MVDLFFCIYRLHTAVGCVCQWWWGTNNCLQQKVWAFPDYQTSTKDQAMQLGMYSQVNQVKIEYTYVKVWVHSG